MCCQRFWKRMVVFILTFGLGVLVSNVLISKALPSENIKPAVNSAPENLKSNNDSIPTATNCVPVDGKLAYIPLTANEDKSKTAVNPEINKDKKAKNKEPNPEKKAEEMKKDSDKSLKDPPLAETLLYKEKCFEAQVPK